uniref:Uncharacterized protein n=1 Tax=Coprothermobacter proteolyticus (strain ATCC 35245 / DSM 5265 / OCM 4 / BT) TaxID=309798 RepID=B5Y9W1_COPPD
MAKFTSTLTTPGVCAMAVLTVLTQEAQDIPLTSTTAFFFAIFFTIQNNVLTYSITRIKYE